MESSACRILLVEDSPSDAMLLRLALEERGTGWFALTHELRLGDALGRLASDRFDIVLLDLSLPDSGGLETFDKVHKAAPYMPIVVMTGLDSEELGATLVQHGAQDYLVKGQADGGALARCLRYAIERKKVQTALTEAREAALAAARAKGEFLAAMSHEIRTPMNAILGMADLLLETPLSGEQEGYVRVLQRAGAGLLSLINGVLDLAKVEAGRLELDEVVFHPEDFFATTIEMLAFSAHKKGLDLVLHVQPDVPRAVVGDANRLRQVLVNLLGNAIKFTASGEVVLRVRVDQEALDATVLHFSVSDTGIGVDPAKRDAIFGSFTQADATITRRYGGTGLGLTLSQRLVELMGGRITVEGAPGGGSTFSFTARFGLPASQPGAPRPPEWLRGLRVLVVDDNPTERAVAVELLSGWGARVTEAADGEGVLAALAGAAPAARPPDLVLLDGRMPGMDGFAVAEAMGRTGALGARTVMMLTTEQATRDMARSAELRLGGHLLKPIRRAPLLEAVAAALRPADSATRETPALAPEWAGRRLRILLVEDFEDNLLLMLSYLKKMPFDVDVAEDGTFAVEKFKAAKYDLVLMDMQMPVMDGHDATRAIREWERTQGRAPTPILALTAHAFREDVERSLAAGCDGHLTKPISKEHLLEAIAEHTGARTPAVSRSAGTAAAPAGSPAEAG